jgi:hypothetical protein
LVFVLVAPVSGSVLLVVVLVVEPVGAAAAEGSEAGMALESVGAVVVVDVVAAPLGIPVASVVGVVEVVVCWVMPGAGAVWAKAAAGSRTAAAVAISIVRMYLSSCFFSNR